jgi:hypothetical protein
MPAIPQQTLVTELGDRLDDYSRRQVELLHCLRNLRHEFLALRAARALPPPPPISVLARRFPPPPPPQSLTEAAAVAGRSVGSPGLTLRRDYNYFTDLDSRLARLRTDTEDSQAC